jgi:hypothetical protein
MHASVSPRMADEHRSERDQSPVVEVFTQARERFKHYLDDWRDGFDAALKLVASAVYIFFMSLMKSYDPLRMHHIHQFTNLPTARSY